MLKFDKPLCNYNYFITFAKQNNKLNKTNEMNHKSIINRVQKAWDIFIQEYDGSRFEREESFIEFLMEEHKITKDKAIERLEIWKQFGE